MNRCPSCRNLVPANWIACRRCGAALMPGREDGDQTLLRPASVPRSTATLPRAATAVPVRRPHHVGQDTLVPRASGTRRDTLVPITARATATAPRRLSPAWQRRLVVGVVALGLFVSLRMSWHVAFTPEPIRNAQATAAAVERLDRTVNVARTFFVRDGAYDMLIVKEFAGKTGDVLVVDAGTVARTGQVSIKGRPDATAIFATPGSGDICVFARDEPMARRIEFATTVGQACRAAEPPEKGWNPA